MVTQILYFLKNACFQVQEKKSTHIPITTEKNKTRLHVDILILSIFNTINNLQHMEVVSRRSSFTVYSQGK